MDRGLLFPEDREGSRRGASPEDLNDLVRVVVERGIDEPAPRIRAPGGAGAEEGLTYINAGLEVGARVEAPLGRGDTPVAGYIVARGGAELLGSLDASKLKRVRRAAGPTLSADLLDLARWVSRYYVTPLGMVLSSMTPAGAKKAVGRRREAVLSPGASIDAAVEAALTPAVRRAWDALRTLTADAFPLTAKEAAAAAGRPSVREVNALIRCGLLRESVRERVAVRGASAVDEAWIDRSPPPALTDAQRRVVDGVWPADGEAAPGFGVHLLFGVTGSGKTEVYLRLIERCLAAGRSAIVLVPEIGLTPQTGGRFMGRFPGAGVAVLHSGLSASARHEAWDRARRGEARVVLGPRSAVFSPCPDLGLIIVDEEHDGSYKQDSLPRYHGRDVAIKRAQAAGAPVLLGSATPSLESWRNATREPRRFTLWRLGERVAGGRLPRVRVVDFVEERRRSRERGDRCGALIGPTLLDAMVSALGAGGQAVLLLNRRGYAGRLVCADQRCGWVLRCHHCDVAMTLHRAGVRDGQRAPRGFLRCHQCRAERVVPSRCPACEGAIQRLGVGVQQAEATLRELLAERCGLRNASDLVRVDSDVTSSPRALQDTLRRFASGDARVALGTQMLAKGLDVPNVRLVGVLDADTSLVIPDFRAAERTFQLVSQVAGRAGRRGGHAEVVVQSMDPAQDAVRLAAEHDFASFAELELAERKAMGLPPVTRMARIVCRDRRIDRAESSAAAVASALRDGARPGLTVVGPAPCGIPRIADHFRFAVELTAPTAGLLQAALQDLRRSAAIKSDQKTAVDVDPVSLM